MELDEFVSRTITALIKAVKDAGDNAKSHGACVNPIIPGTGNHSGKDGSYVKIERNESASAVTDIKFDIAVTVSETRESGVGGGINVLSLKKGGKLSDSDLNQTISRIQFSVPVALPSFCLIHK